MIRTKAVKGVLVALTTLFLTSSFATAQEPPEPDRSSEYALERLAAATEKLAVAIEKETQEKKEAARLERLELAIAYLNFRSRRIETLEQEIIALKTKRSHLTEVIEHRKSQQLNIEDKLKGGLSGEVAELKKQDETFRNNISLQQGLLDRLDEDIVVLENRHFELQNQIGDLEDYVHRNLEL